VVAKCAVAHQALLDAQLEFAKAEGTLKAAKSQAKNSAQRTCRKLHLPKIQEDDRPNLNHSNNWYKGHELLIACKAQDGGDTCVPRNPLPGAAKDKEQDEDAQQQQQLKKLICWVGVNQ
jgi:hypothetical protein